MASINELIMKAAGSLGYSDLKQEQKIVLKPFVGGMFLLRFPLAMASLCYALLPLIFNMSRGLVERTLICMIVSPLIALMKDQSTSFTAKGIPAANVSDKDSTDKETRRNIVRGECQLVFISPEALFLATEWRRMLSGDYYRKHLVGLIVDEAHCIKKWGDTFRRKFSRLGEVRSIIPENVNVMALTATATKSNRADIIKSLCMQKPVIVSTPPIKDNIHFCVSEKSSISLSLSLVCEALANQRTKMGRIIMAIGMGVDCPDVRQVIHWGVPEDAETYVQEPGRDGKLSCAQLFYGKGELGKKRTSELMKTYCKT